MLSPILKLVALLAAAFCVYAWFDVRGKISDAEAQMEQIKGETLAEKSVSAANIDKENKQRKVKIAAFEKRVAALQKDINSVNSELESERAKNVSANSDIVKGNAEIRSLKSELSKANRSIDDRNATIESLKRGILASKELLAKQADTDSLKAKISELERTIEDQKQELDKANKKAKLAEMSEVVEIVETDASGNKVKRKIVRTPYVPSGDIATVLAFDKSNYILVINKGKENGIEQGQVIQLKKNGVVIATTFAQNVKENISSLIVDKDSVMPEYIKQDAQFELSAPAQETEAPKQEEQ